MSINTLGKSIRLLNVLWIYILFGVLCGAYTYQIIERENPCPLCELQRLGMIAVAIGPILNLRFGLRPGHYGLSIIGAIFGASVSLRQISLHICPDFPKFGIRIFGFELYTWAFFVFSASILAAGILLIIQSLPQKEEQNHIVFDPRTLSSMTVFEKGAIFSILLIAMANFITTLLQCGMGPCAG